jgi:hypothetical protein
MGILTPKAIKRNNHTVFCASSLLTTKNEFVVPKAT